MKRLFYFPAILTLLLCSCKKDDGIRQLTFPEFTASVNGNQLSFAEPVTAVSRPDNAGGYELVITGSRQITADSAVQIRFTIPDFTRTTAVSVNHALNSNFNGNFIEAKQTTPSSQFRYHFFQNGQLTVTAQRKDMIEGTFIFKYFLFDALGNKTGEVAVSNGSFKEVIIER
ncbi:hypothetical protein [Sediminibacterium ginsengisoli]|uniref:Uncharacterized protein n=1 Tax=Sediminibacterium ginsengisoli TaxID=413434 RepID=A0A1T4QVC7_9BACT|nr:hypothetical protein [Sediminibacterium ginsengisoli]SKA07644.1 hypothetical protein SAMN04488132_109130 [Sediminibacterium ginsengisoli]